MSPHQKFNYARDQAFQKFRNYESVKLPPKIRCDVCKKYKTTEVGFSKKKQQDIRKVIARGRVDVNKENGDLGAICRDCSGTQKFEMTCSICHYVKGLDGFSKAQRKTPDSARCIRCVTMIEQEDPVEGTATEEYLRRLAEDSDEEDDDYDDSVTNPYAENSEWGTHGGVAVSSQYSTRVTEESLGKLNIGSKQVADDDQSVGTSSWKEFASNPGAANAFNQRYSTPGRPWTAYDPNGRGHTLHQASSVADTNSSYATTARASTTPRQIPDRTSKFAKERAVKQKKKELPTYAGGKPAQDEDDDDEDEDDDFFTI